jgi:hypothetical protein
VNPHLSLSVTFSRIFIIVFKGGARYYLEELLQRVTSNLLRKGLNIGLVLRLFGDEM